MKMLLLPTLLLSSTFAAAENFYCFANTVDDMNVAVVTPIFSRDFSTLKIQGMFRLCMEEGFQHAGTSQCISEYAAGDLEFERSRTVAEYKRRGFRIWEVCGMGKP